MLGLLKVKGVHDKVGLKHKQKFISALRLQTIKDIYEGSIQEYEKIKDSYCQKSGEIADSLEYWQNKQYVGLQCAVASCQP